MTSREQNPSDDATTLKLHFESPDDLRAWLDGGMPMPDGLKFEHFHELAWPSRVSENRIADAARFAAFRAQAGPEGCLFGPLLNAQYFLYENGPARLEFVPAPLHDMEVTAAAEGLLTFFAGQGASFAFASRWSELFHRNLYAYDLWGDGRLSTTMLGRDSRRYIPGLYWLTYFSRKYADKSGLSPKEVSGGLPNVRVIELADGYLIKLYESPAAWAMHAGEVDAFLARHERFFSLANVLKPIGLGPRELVSWFQELTELYP